MIKKILIDATGATFGRLCSYVAKQALEGNEIFIFNCEETIISGNKKNIIEKYSKMKKRGGTAHKGPNYSRVPVMMLKRAIRGMLPNYRRGIGKQAFSRIKCYEGIPKDFEKEKLSKFLSREYDHYIELKELSQRI